MVVLEWGKHGESKGAVHILKGTARTASQVTHRKFAEGSEEPLGLVVVNDTLYVLAMDKLVRLIDKDKDGIAELQEIVTDNQGGYFPASKIIHAKPGRFYGHHASPPDAFDG